MFPERVSRQLILALAAYKSHSDMDAGRYSAASPSGREGLIAASQGVSRLYQKLASDPGRNSPDDPFKASTSITHGSMRQVGDARHAHTYEAQSVSSHGPAQSVDGLLPSGPSVEIMGTELYDTELV